MAIAKPVRITVMRKLSTKDVYGDIREAETIDGFISLCPKLQEGQEFIVESNGDMPQGFCSWAWADIQRDVSVLRFGGNFSWMKDSTGATYACCTDGLRPVFFKLERLVE